MGILRILSLQDGKLVAIIGIVAVVIILFQRHLQNRGLLPLPPKPAGWPLIGNTLEFIAAAKKGEMHLLLQKWAKQHGEIIRVQIGPVTNFYLNSDRAVKAIMDKASAQTSERPRWIVSSELLCNNWNVLLLHASDPRWKLQRKITHSEMTSIPKADAGLPFLHHETLKFMHEVMHDPNVGTPAQALWTQIGRYTYSNFAMQAFGFEIESAQDPAIPYIFHSGERMIEATLPGSAIVDILPFLEKLPMYLKPWEKMARAAFQEDLEWVRERAKFVQQNAKPEQISLFLNILRDEKRLGLESLDEAAFLSMQLIIGAADTSRMSTWSFLEAMMMFPDVQEEAKAQIDRVVGDRIPIWEDLESIPYVRYLMKEVWRFRPPVPLGHPHTTLKDLEYNGMRIPRGSRLQLNAWAIGHDATRHPDPEIFRPERYMGDTNTTQQSINLADPSKRDHFAFGAGRRVCPGMHVAERSLGVSIMRILWAFDIKPSSIAKLPLNPKDYYGFMPGNAGPQLPVTIVARNERRKQLIDETWAWVSVGKQ
ncbi:related to O-methylsterigmatocystin oxidoreductase [Phialocephala subalpina]|uniref:Related to O-methylsterigmatocystin oxidoreductase n=1 Tax=Phialocephala subalpina TaxID=576137 RepID=A0A1L7X4D2_9HELO|nr:related to O-methylsterigmatocystin oxidoreductase [Phialocephala subalpina]